MEATAEFAKHIANTNYENIPPEIVDVVKKTLLDSLGVCVAGSMAPGGREVAELVKEWGGKGESTVIAHQYRAPSINAAFANGAMLRSLDYNETHELTRSHPSMPVIPAALAMAEKAGNISGKELITAIALAFDVMCRISSAVPHPADWHLTQLVGFFAAAVAAGKLLNLTEEEIIGAFGIAYSQASGGRQSAFEGAPTRNLLGAFAAKGGILAALMAKKGIYGPSESLEGRYGLYNIYYGGEYSHETLTSELGKKFLGGDLAFKPYPCCRGMHTHIDAALEIVRQNDVYPDEIEGVIVFTGEFAQTLFTPLEGLRDPKTVSECQVSGPYVISVAVTNRNVGVDDFLGGGFRDPLVLQMAQRIVSRFEPQFSVRGIEPGMVELKTRDGRVFTKRVEFAKGHPSNPMNMDDIIAKFIDCLQYGARPIPEKNSNQVIELVNQLENVDNIGSILQLLA